MKYSILLCFSLMSAFAFGQIEFEHEEWGRVKKQASEENKIIFVDAYTTWCGPCKWMAKNVFTDTEVGEFYNANFINLKLDMEKGEGLGFAQEYQVNAYPTLLFLDGEGNLLHKQLGALPADRFLLVGQDALSPEKRISTYIDKYPSMKDNPEFLREYIMRMANAGMPTGDAVDNYFSILSTDDVATEENLLILQMTDPARESKAFKTLLANRDAFNEVGGKEMIDALVQGVLMNEMYRASVSKDPNTYPKVRAEIAAMDLPEKDRILAMGDMEYSDAQDDTEGYLKHAAAYTKKYAWNDWNELNNVAWDMYLNSELDTKKELKLAYKLSKRAVKLEPNYYTTDTYASVLYKIGKYDKALEWANKAIDAAKAAGEDYAGTSALVDKINAARK